ncbi:MAG TPA: hypothetical protein DER26_00755 [Verrucomicrobia bacterium]|nr:hypothetical protein [Verrucomicrobiota bacterium]
MTVKSLLMGAAAAGSTLACAALGMSRADEYRYIVSGWPVANECQSSASAAGPLDTGTLATHSSATSLEARFRTSCTSGGVLTNSGFMLIFQ